MNPKLINVIKRWKQSAKEKKEFKFWPNEKSGVL